MQLPTKTIQIPSIPCQNRKTFLYNVKKYVFELAIVNKAVFVAQGLKNEYIHESIQQQEIRKNYNNSQPKENRITQHPIYIHSSIKDNCFTLKAFGEKGLACLAIWLELFKKHPDIKGKPLTITTQETITNLGITENTYDYISTNWIPYRNCKLQKGFYYDLDKKIIQVANFEERLKGNIITFLNQTCGITTIDKTQIWLIVTKIENLGKKLAVNQQEKEAFKIVFHCNVQLPENFSLGQNVAYGNGVFFRKNKK